MKIWSNLKGWQKGAILGGMWGLLVTPLYMLVGFMWWEKDFPKPLEEFLRFFLYFPLQLISSLITFHPSWYLGLSLNIVGWALIGALIGFLYGKLIGAKDK